MMVRTHARFGPRALPLVLLGLVSGLSFASAQDGEGEGEAEETIRYTIQQGDTCYGIAQRFFGNPRQCHEVIYRYNPQMGSDASNIRPGVVITIPVRSRNAPDARVTRTARQVQARASGGADWRAARRGLGLYRGWHVSTEEASSAEVTFRDDSQIQMRENTLVIIYGGSSENTARRRTSQATLEQGTLRSRLGSLRLQVDTPSGQADLDGGSSVVSVDGEGSSVVSNHSGGSARVRGATGAPVTVRPGYGSTVARGERPARPRPLPAAPSLTEGTRRNVVGVVGAGGTLVGEWSEVGGAAYYRVELSTEPDGAGLIAAVQAPSTVTRFEVHRLPAGTYYLALATIDASRLESRPSERVPFTVSLVGLQAPGAAEPDLSSVTEGDWGRPASAPMVLRGTRFFSPDGYSCSIADAPPVARGLFERPGRAELTCVDTAGATQPALAVEVDAVALSVEGVAPGAAPDLVRGSSRALTFVFDETRPLPEQLTVLAPEGVTVTDVQRAEGRMVVTVTAGPDAPTDFELALAVPPPTPDAGDVDGAATVLAELAVHVQEPPPETVTPPPPPVEHVELVAAARPQEAFGLAAHPSLLGLVNDRRVGSGGFLVVSHQGRLAQDEGYWRATVGVEAAPTAGLRVGVAHAIDVVESGPTPARRGDRDLLAWVGYRLLARQNLSLYSELGAWFPTGGAREGIGVVRLAPSLSLSVRAGDRLLLRTRQGALLAADGAGPFLWGSAYGVDAQLVDELYLGLEVDSSIGRADGDLFTGLGVGLGLSVLVGPATFTLGARYGLTNDFQDSVGRFTLSAGVRIALE
ncbi:MAG: LysM peptidoglycan-binding domain-containing protein [Sandaracinaceae bacterium]|nr:LysM peptidoglycan-binding domain-containing protein [Sandaracinaceae bacterium]